MNVDEFWDIVGRVHRASGGNMNVKCDLLERELRQRSRGEIRSFKEHFDFCFERAYTWGLWGAAFVIRRGCGEGSFRNFRSALISLGREQYEQCLTDPDALAAVNLDAKNVAIEGYQHVAARLLGQDPPPSDADAASPDGLRPARKPTGVPFKEWEMSARYPKLVAKYGYKDSDWLSRKEEAERTDKKYDYTIARAGQENHRQGVLAELWLDAGVIPPSGWIPPRPVVARVLREGQFVNGTQQTQWLPFELKEEDYWRALAWLEKAGATALNQGSQPIEPKQLRHDHTIPRNDDYVAWIRSLKDRGMVK